MIVDDKDDECEMNEPSVAQRARPSWSVILYDSLYPRMESSQLRSKPHQQDTWSMLFVAVTGFLHGVCSNISQA
jgi:hypothetical protein